MTCSENALYLPAIQSNYVTFDTNKSRLPWYTEDIHNFLKGKQGLYDPVALYSAGHAKLNPLKSKQIEIMVHDRDPDSFLLADSGGYQWATGAWKTDWHDPDDMNSIRSQVLAWQETNFDYAMTLDLPTKALADNKDLPFTTMEECLQVTQENLGFIERNRTPGRVKFLNVLQGRNLVEANAWYKAVRHYDFEGWAIAGESTGDVLMLIHRLAQLQKDGELQDKDLVHILGVGALPMACILSECQRQLRKTTNPNLTISFDTSSPALSAGRYGDMFGFRDLSQRANRKKTSMVYFDAPADEVFRADTRTLFEFMQENNRGDEQVPTEVSARVRLCDLNIREGETPWDKDSVIMLTNHNIEVQFRMLRRAYKEYQREGLTTELRFFRDHVASDIFGSSNPVAAVRKHHDFLKRLSIKSKIVVEPNPVLFIDLLNREIQPCWSHAV